MARIIGGRVLPTFLPATPTNELEPTWEELIDKGIKLKQKMDDSLQKVTDFLFSYISLRKTNKRHGVSVVAKSPYDEFGEESNEPEDSDPIQYEC